MARNQFVIDGEIAKSDILRYTPAGVAFSSFTLRHTSQQLENSHLVTINVEIEVVAYGALAEQMADLEVGKKISIKGFLNRKSQYNGVNRLHATQFKFL